MILDHSSAVFDVDAFFDHEVKNFTDALAGFERRIPRSAEPQHDETLRELIAVCHQSREDCLQAERAIGDNQELLKKVQIRFREAIAQYLDQSWFLQRAKVKPRGYPGDYEMLTAIYDGKPKSTGLGGYLDLYFLGTDLARAVCARLDAIQKFLIREVLHRTTRVSILNVASGPGREYSQGMDIPDTVSLTCVDTDEKALEYLRSHIDPQMSDNLDLNCVSYNALKMTSPKTNIERFGQPDMIYSVGLCDYIPDRYLIKILNGWRESVGEDGIVYVAFKDGPMYFAAEYQWHVDWFFYQRTEADCRRLFAEAGYDVDAMEMFRDETGIIMNFVARKPALRRLRLDAAEQLRGPHNRLRPAQDPLLPEPNVSEV